MTVLWRAVVRTVPFLAIFWLARFLPVPADVVGENVGLGLLIFSLTAGYAAVWSAVDSLMMPVGRTLRIWVTAAVLLGLEQPVLGLLDSSHRYGVTQARTDLANLSMFMIALVTLFTTLAVLITDRVMSRPGPRATSTDEPATTPVPVPAGVGAATAEPSRARRGRHAAPAADAATTALPTAPVEELAASTATEPVPAGEHAWAAADPTQVPDLGRDTVPAADRPGFPDAEPDVLAAPTDQTAILPLDQDAMTTPVDPVAADPLPAPVPPTPTEILPAGTWFDASVPDVEEPTVAPSPEPVRTPARGRHASGVVAEPADAFWDQASPAAGRHAPRAVEPAVSEPAETDPVEAPERVRGRHATTAAYDAETPAGDSLLGRHSAGQGAADPLPERPAEPEWWGSETAVAPTEVPWWEQATPEAPATGRHAAGAVAEPLDAAPWDETAPVPAAGRHSQGSVDEFATEPVENPVRGRHAPRVADELDRDAETQVLPESGRQAPASPDRPAEAAETGFGQSEPLPGPGRHSASIETPAGDVASEPRTTSGPGRHAGGPGRAAEVDPDPVVTPLERTAEPDPADDSPETSPRRGRHAATPPGRHAARDDASWERENAGAAARAI